MTWKRTILKSLSGAAMSFAVTGMACGQTLDANTDVNLNTDGQVGANATTDSSVTPIDAPPVRTDGAVRGSADTRGNINANTDANVDTNRARTGVRANTDGPQAGASVGSNGVGVNAGANNSGVNAGVNAPGVNGQVNSDGQLNGQINGQNARGSLNTNSNLDANLNSRQNGAQLGTNSSTSTGANLGTRGEQLGFQFNQAAGTDGLIISQTTPNSPAAQLGLRAGDRIIGFNGRTYSDSARFYSDLGQLNSSSVPVIYERDGRIFTQNMSLSQMNGNQSYGTQYGIQTYGNQMNSGAIYQDGQYGNSYSAGRPSYDSSMQMNQPYQQYHMGAGCGVQQSVGYHQSSYQQPISYPVTQAAYGSTGYYGQPYGQSWGHHGRWDDDDDDDDWEDYQKRCRKQRERWHDDD